MDRRGGGIHFDAIQFRFKSLFMNDLFDNRRIVLHPGFVKSATTSLQELVFSRHPEIGG